MLEPVLAPLGREYWAMRRFCAGSCAVVTADGKVLGLVSPASGPTVPLTLRGSVIAGEAVTGEATGIAIVRGGKCGLSGGGAACL